MFDTLRRLTVAVLVPWLLAEPSTAAMRIAQCVVRPDQPLTTRFALRATRDDSSVFGSQALAEHPAFSGNPDEEIPKINRAAAAGLRAPKADPEVLLAQIPELFAQGKYEQIHEDCQLLVKRYLHAYGFRIVPLVPIWMLSMVELQISPAEKETKLDPLVDWFFHQSEDSRDTLGKRTEPPSSSRDALMTLGLGMLYTLKVSGQVNRKSYSGISEGARKAAQYFSEAGDMPGVPDAQKFSEPKWAMEGDLYWLLSYAHADLWERTQDLIHLEELTEDYRLSARAFVQARPFAAGRLGSACALYAWNSLYVAEYHSEPPAASLERAKLLLAQAKDANVDPATATALEGFIAAREGRLQEAYDKLRKGLAKVDDDQIRSALVNVCLRAGNPQEAVTVSATIGQASPRDLYERGRAHYELALRSSEAPKGRQKEYELTWKSWTQLTETTRKVLDYMGEANRYDVDFLRVCLILDKTDGAVRMATRLLSREEAAHHSTFNLIHELLPLHKEIAFLKTLHQGIPGPYKGLVAARREYLEAIARAAGAPSAGKSAAGSKKKSPVTDAGTLIAEWNGHKGDKRTNRSDVDKFFEKGLWAKQSALWRLGQLQDWVRDWWRWPPNSDAKGTPPMAHRGEILDRLVKELEATVLEIDEHNVPADQDAISGPHLDDILRLLEPWKKKKPGEDSRMEPLRLQTPPLPRAVTKTMEVVETVKDKRDRMAQFAALRTLAEPFEDHSPSDYLGTSGPAALLRSQVKDLHGKALAITAKTPLHIRLAIKPAMEAALVPLEALHETVQKEEGRIVAAARHPDFERRLGVIGGRLTSRVAAAKTRLGELTQSLEPLGVKIRIEQAKRLPVTVTLRSSRVALGLVTKGEQAPESEVTLKSGQSYLTLLWDRGIMTAAVDLYEGGNLVTDLNQRPASGAVITMVRHGDPRPAEWPEPVDDGPPEPGLSVQAALALEPPFAQEFAAVMATQRQEGWEAWAAVGPGDPVYLPEVTFEVNSLIAPTVRITLGITEFDHEKFQILRNGQDVGPEETFQGGEEITVRRRPASTSGIALVGEPALRKQFRLPNGGDLADRMANLLAKKNQTHVPLSEYDHKLFGSPLRKALSMLPGHPGVRRLQAQRRWWSVNASRVRVILGAAPDNRPWHKLLYADPRTGTIYIHEAFLQRLWDRTVIFGHLKFEPQAFIEYLAEALGHENLELLGGTHEEALALFEKSGELDSLLATRASGKAVVVSRVKKYMACAVLIATSILPVSAPLFALWEEWPTLLNALGEEILLKDYRKPGVRGVVRRVLSDMNKHVLPYIGTKDSPLTQLDDWLVDAASGAVEDKETPDDSDLMRNARAIREYSPRASALFFGMLGPHLRRDFRETDQIDLDIMPVLLSGFLPHLNRLLDIAAAARRRGKPDQALEDEALHYTGLLVNGLMFDPIPIGQSYLRVFEMIMDKADALGVDGSRDILNRSLDYFSDYFPRDSRWIPEPLLQGNELYGKSELERLRTENGWRVPLARFEAWDVFAVHPRAWAYYQWIRPQRLSAKIENLKDNYLFLHDVRGRTPAAAPTEAAAVNFGLGGSPLFLRRNAERRAAHLRAQAA